MNIAIIFFSATGNTRKMAEVIKDAFLGENAEVDLFDVTTMDSRKANTDFSFYDALIFGLPVHSLRAPRLMRQWLKTLDGKGRKCGMFFTYGGFEIHPAHYSTAKILEERNFTVVSSAEFPGKHTYNLGGWRAFTDRPDSREFKLAKDYVKATYRRFTGEDKNMIGELERSIFSDEELDHFESLRYKMITTLPTREGAECGMCGTCESVCSTGAMDYTAGEVNPNKCIACLGCVANCPENALKINSTELFWDKKLSMSKITETELNDQMGKIYL
jgi:ferredoxin/flavodoxin